jgi:hypothetical protein
MSAALRVGSMVAGKGARRAAEKVAAMADMTDFVSAARKAGSKVAA